jgi:hypothetical protein
VECGGNAPPATEEFNAGENRKQNVKNRTIDLTYMLLNQRRSRRKSKG